MAAFGVVDLRSKPSRVTSLDGPTECYLEIYILSLFNVLL